MTCPICGGPIGYVSRRGPMDAIVNPCGCQLGSVSVSDLLEGDRREVLTDGGTATDGTEQTDGYLKFAHENIGCIVDGYEDATIRVGLEREFWPGQRIELRSPKDRVFGYAKVEEVHEGRLGQVHFDAVFLDKRTHPSHSDEDLLKRLRRHYGRDVTFDTEVTAIYFKPTKVCTPRELKPDTDHEEGAA